MKATSPSRKFCRENLRDVLDRTANPRNTRMEAKGWGERRIEAPFQENQGPKGAVEPYADVYLVTNNTRITGSQCDTKSRAYEMYPEVHRDKPHGGSSRFAKRSLVPSCTCPVWAPLQAKDKWRHGKLRGVSNE